MFRMIVAIFVALAALAFPATLGLRTNKADGELVLGPTGLATKATPDEANADTKPLVGLEAGQKRARKLSSVETVLEAKTRLEAARAYTALFKEHAPERLCALESDRFSGVAMRAAWELVCRSVPEDYERGSFEIDRSRLARFIGFCEGRIRCSIPHWWVNTVQSAEAHGRSNVFFSLPKECEYPIEKRGLSLRLRADIFKSGAAHWFRIGRDNVFLPEDFLASAEGHGPSPRATGSFTETRAFVAVHSNCCYPYHVLCIDRIKETPAWRAYVFAAGDDRAYFGHSDHFVDLVSEDTRLLVFGAGPDCAYIEAFRVTDGRVLFRFSTAY